MSRATESQLAHYLIDQKLLPGTAFELLTAAKNAGLTLVTWAYQQVRSPNVLATAIAQCFQLSVCDLEQIDLNTLPIDLIDSQLLQQHQCLPLAHQDRHLTLAIADPTQTHTVDLIQFQLGLSVQQVISTPTTLQQAITQALSKNHYHAAESLAQRDPSERNEAHIIHFIDQVFLDAFSRHASDVHFEHYADQYRIRLRIDGLLHTITTPALELAAPISTRLKVLSQLDITERRLPQDGRFTLKLPNQPPRDCRINTLPCLHGEKIVVRLLGRMQTTLGMNALGMTPAQQKLFTQAIEQPQGMVLVTGPTGSGKTITLYSALATLDALRKNITTIEEPVEIEVPGINQISIHPKIGLTFASTLRALLRQDPDIIMVGEIRDLETAEIAIKASQTGHLVLATLHTNSAVATINRLLNLGISAQSITEVVKLIIAQRLVRKLCSHCKTAVTLTATTGKLLQGLPENTRTPTCYAPRGCQHCLDGYQGRVGIFELLPITTAVHNQLLKQHTLADETQLFKQLKTATLLQAGLICVNDGCTSLAELKRVIGYMDE